MLDLKYIRENAKAVEENTRNRGIQAHVGLDPTVPRVLLDGFRVLADVFEI